MKRLRLLIAAIVLLATTGVLALNTNRGLCNESYRHDLNIKVAGQTIKAQKSHTPGELSKGLGNKQCIGEKQAMLFIFDKPGYYPFWMKDMRFPIDIIWLSADKKVVHIESNVQPSSYPQTYANTSPARYVLELKAGQAHVYNISTGTQFSY